MSIRIRPCALCGAVLPGIQLPSAGVNPHPGADMFAQSQLTARTMNVSVKPWQFHGSFIGINGVTVNETCQGRIGKFTLMDQLV